MGGNVQSDKTLPPLRRQLPINWRCGNFQYVRLQTTLDGPPFHFPLSTFDRRKTEHGLTTSRAVVVVVKW
eukprot:scaffold104194_cov32-Tisochrysis_lutea.AAC.1